MRLSRLLPSEPVRLRQDFAVEKETSPFNAGGFVDSDKLKAYMQGQPATRFLSHGRYSEALLKNDAAVLEGQYRANGYRHV